MEDEKKRDARTEFDSSSSGDSQSDAEKQKQTPIMDSDTGISRPEALAEKEINAAPSSEAAKIDESQGSPEVHAKIGENEAPEKKQTDAADNSGKERIEEPPDEEKAHQPAKKIFSAKLALSVVIIVAVFSGFFVFENKSKPKATKKEKLSVLNNRRSLQPKQQKNQSALTAGASGLLDAKISEIMALRDALLQKQAEILELKNEYQKRIDELEKEIADEMQRAGISTFLQAMENRRVQFGLQTIQRRQNYIRKLEKPSNWIFEACEELLYIKRQAMVDLQVAEIASGIDLNRHMQQMEVAADRYKLTAEKLAIDLTDAQSESLEKIWERIQHNRLKNTAVHFQSKNQVISEQICQGDFELLTELTEISAETAKCVTRMPGSGLFLSGLTELPPAAARNLFQWNGSWICLNGLRVLSPRAAHYLFQWRGDWISLNGLTEFPADIGQALLQWNGAQLELMGLQHIAGPPEKIGIEFLAHWERLGGKLFVPDDVRKMITAINREPAGTR